MLRRYEASDLAALQDLVATSLENIRPWMPNATRELSGDLVEWLRIVGEMYDNRSRYPYAICLHDGTFVGHVTATPDEGFVEIGYWMHVDHLRHGYMGEAVSGVVEAFSPATFRINCSPDNAASRGVAQKAGFTHVGSNPVELDGVSYDQMRWELVTTDH